MDCTIVGLLHGINILNRHEWYDVYALHWAFQSTSTCLQLIKLLYDIKHLLSKLAAPFLRLVKKFDDVLCGLKIVRMGLAKKLEALIVTYPCKWIDRLVFVTSVCFTSPGNKLFMQRLPVSLGSKVLALALDTDRSSWLKDDTKMIGIAEKKV